MTASAIYSGRCRWPQTAILPSRACEASGLQCRTNDGTDPRRRAGEATVDVVLAIADHDRWGIHQQARRLARPLSTSGCPLAKWRCQALPRSCRLQVLFNAHSSEAQPRYGVTNDACQPWRSDVSPAQTRATYSMIRLRIIIWCGARSGCLDREEPRSTVPLAACSRASAGRPQRQSLRR
jgi:hypothetical protein